MKLFSKTEVKRLPKPELKRIPTGRADSACYHIAKMINRCYEEEVERPARGRKAKVVC